MAGVVGQQEYWIVGSRFYFQKDDDTYYKALFDLGTIKVVSPSVQTTSVDLVDSDGGSQKVVDSTLIKATESYDITCNNHTLDNLALLFMSAEPDNFTQAATVLTNVAHKAVIGAGKMIKLHDASGNWLYSVASIVVKNGAATVTYTENTDWKWINKDRAVIQVLAGGSIGHGQDLAITITPVAVTGRRLIRPQTNAKAIRGRAMLVWSRNANAEQTVREFDCSISPTAAAFNDADYSSFTLQAKVLSDITDTTYPAGLLLQFVGTLPTPATP